jgi:hypothetical protein
MTTTGKSVHYTDAFTVMMLGFVGLITGGLGVLFITSALDGAHMIPNLFVREGYEYTAYQAVTILLVGQAFLAVACGFAYLIYKEVTGK